MKPDQIHVLAAAVFGDSKQVFHALEPGLTGQIVGDVCNGDGNDGIHDDVAIVHSVTAADFDVRPRPDANAASDSSTADALAKVLAWSAPRLREGIRRVESAALDLAAVVEPLRRVAGEPTEPPGEEAERYRFGVSTLESQQIRVLTLVDLARAAETARRELRV